MLGLTASCGLRFPCKTIPEKLDEKGLLQDSQRAGSVPPAAGLMQGLTASRRSRDAVQTLCRRIKRERSLPDGHWSAVCAAQASPRIDERPDCLGRVKIAVTISNIATLPKTVSKSMKVSIQHYSTGRLSIVGKLHKLLLFR